MNRLSVLTVIVGICFTHIAMSSQVEWVAGQTQVNNGDRVIHQGSCYEAKNTPGVWETPSNSSSWFWTPVVCITDSEPPISPPICNDGQTLIDNTCVENETPLETTATPWVGGETSVNNGDVVSYENQCYKAKNSPGSWETPKTNSWFWTVTECPTSNPSDPVTCPDGTVANSELDCSVPPIPIECPDGTVVEDVSLCSIVSGHYYISPQGSDSNDGSYSSPYKTLKKALSNAGSGTKIEMLPGRYQAAQVIDRVQGNAFSPIMITGTGAVFDGSIDIETTWIPHDGQIYKTKIDQDIWQLFIDEQVVIPARWPNAQLSDGSLWDMKTTWRHQAPESQLGHMIDERPYANIEVKTAGNVYELLPDGVNTQSLGETGFDVTGAIAILNIGSWLNWAQVVESHTAGSNQFAYSSDFSGSGAAMNNAASILKNSTFWNNKNGKYEEGHYYLEGKLEFLDSPNEWYFDSATKMLYLWAPDGTDPNSLYIKGKQQTYGLTVRNSSYVTIKGIDFFSTAFTVISSNNITFDGISAKHYAYSKRMLGDLTRPETIKLINNNSAIARSENSIINSKLSYTDGPALEVIKEVGDVIDNNLIHDIDYSNLGTGGEGSINMASQSREITFSNNTFHTAGNSEGVRVGAESNVHGNHIYNTNLLQHDGAAINVGIDEQAGTNIAYNWVHDTSKAGIRFDGVEGAAKTGRDGLVHHNVVWNSDFSIIKGDYQGTYNNLMFDNQTVDLIIFNKETAGGINHSSETMNNLVGTLQGRKSGSAEQLIVPGTSVSNVTGAASNILANLKGPKWGDFRPIKDSDIVDAGTNNTQLMQIEYVGLAPDIGAYEADALTYRMAGHREAMPTNPVPFDGSTLVSQYPELFFNTLARENNTKVYIGVSPNDMQELLSLESRYVPNQLLANTQYFWQVETKNESAVIQGPVWTFITAP